MESIITFNKPNQDGPMSLERAIATRRSHRSFSSKPLTLEQIGQLTWAAQGQAPGGNYRTAPSAGATYPLELYIVTGDGLFCYLPAEHALKTVSDTDLRAGLASAALGQSFIETAPLTIVFVAEFIRTTNRYGERGIRYIYMEAGHAAQNVQLQAQAMGFGSVAVGAFDDNEVSKVMSLPENLDPLYMVTIGYCR